MGIKEGASSYGIVEACRQGIDGLFGNYRPDKTRFDYVDDVYYPYKHSTYPSVVILTYFQLRCQA